MRRVAVPALVSVFLVLMGFAWLIADPPGAYLDESAHYIKALGVAGGDFEGELPAPTHAEAVAFLRKAARGDRSAAGLAKESRSPAARWQARTTRQFDIPRPLFPAGFGCTARGPKVTADCLDHPPPAPARPALSASGTYQPYLFLPAGLAARIADSPRTGVRLGRAALLAISLGLLVAAVWLLWDPRAPGTSLLGFVVAVTPLVLFVASVLTPSGPEIAAAVCFSAALIRLTRSERPPRGLWLALGAGGAVLASARALGPAFVLLLVAVVAVLGGPRALWRRLQDARMGAAAAAAAVLIAALASVWWEFSIQPRPHPTGSSVVDALGPSLAALPTIGREVVGVFGALDVLIPEPGYVLWLLLVLALLAAALWVGTARDRTATLALTAGAVVVVVVMSVVYREIGPLHGRYAMPALVLVPLWAGEVVHRRRPPDSRPVAWLVAGAFTVAAAVHLLGWLADGRRYAVGEGGSWLFFRHPGWSPPLGWAPWLVLATLATVAYLAAGLLATAGTRAADRDPAASMAP